MKPADAKAPAADKMKPSSKMSADEKAAGMKAFSRPHVNPINTETPALKRGVKPD